MSFADRIKSADEISRSDGIKCLIYGPAGVGKTTLATTTGAPEKTLVLSAESGLLSIQHSGVQCVPVSNLNDLREAHHFLAKGSHSFEWVILDSISEIGEQVLAEELPKHRNMLQAYGELGKVMIPLIKAFRDLPMNALFIAKMDSFEDDGVVKYRPSFPGSKVKGELPYLFDEVFAYRSVRSQDEEGNEVNKRAFYTSADGKYEAKDRSGRLDTWERPELKAIVDKIRTPAADKAA